MTNSTRELETALRSAGYETIHARGKGGGFWIRGVGYRTLADCRGLLDQAAAETREADLADRRASERYGF